MNVTVAGYYGFGNLGDELILSALLAELRQTVPSARVTVLSADPAGTVRRHGVSAVSRWNPASVLVRLLKSDLFVLGGGGLLQDQTSFGSLAYYLGLAWLARSFGSIVVLYAVGVDKISGRIAKWMIGALCTSARVFV